jgi:hypothetical protein
MEREPENTSVSRVQGHRQRNNRVRKRKQNNIVIHIFMATAVLSLLGKNHVLRCHLPCPFVSLRSQREIME